MTVSVLIPAAVLRDMPRVVGGVRVRDRVGSRRASCGASRDVAGRRATSCGTLQHSATHRWARRMSDRG